jgi:fatty-acyl-CoA synthase
MSVKRSLDVSYWPADSSEPLLELTLGELLRQVAAEVPDRLALIDGNLAVAERRRWTYRELLNLSELTARALLTRFVSGERVAVCAPNCPEWVLLQHGLHLAGLILVPINPAYRQAEIGAILQDSGAVGLFHVDRYRDNDLRAIVKNLRSSSTNLRQTISLAEWDAFISGTDDSVALPNVRPDDILQLQYTSGTTGIPKGACLHHRGALNTARFVALRAGFPEGGVWLNAMPMFHIAGPVVTEIGTISRRGTYVLMPGFDAGQTLELIERERAAAALIVPTMILALLQHEDFPMRRFDSLRTILTGAAMVPALLVHRTKKAFGCELSILFGQTETNGVVSQTSLDDTVEDQSETLGQPLPQSEVAILNPETGEVQPVGAVGEICVRGYQTMQGYFGDVEATRQCVRADGWLRTGDLGTMDRRGYLRIAGRLKDMIIRGGMNLYPREIEDVVFDHPAVGQVSVVGVPDEKWGEVVAAVIVPAAGVREPPWLDLHNHCRERLAAHKTPALWFVVDAFPLTPSGKIQKFVLQEHIARGELRPVQWERPPKPSSGRRQRIGRPTKR